MECKYKCNQDKCLCVGCQKNIFYKLSKNLLKLGFRKIADDLYINDEVELDTYDIIMNVVYNKEGYASLIVNLYNRKRGDYLNVELYQKIDFSIGNNLARLKNLITITIDSLVEANENFKCKIKSI